jgi:predicted DNA-binding protein (UPF0251 family)
MKPELEALLKAYDAFKQTPEGPEAARLFAIYEVELEAAAEFTKTSKEALQNALRRLHPRWVRANLPAGFPKRLGQE